MDDSEREVGERMRYSSCPGLACLAGWLGLAHGANLHGAVEGVAAGGCPRRTTVGGGGGVGCT